MTSFNTQYLSWLLRRFAQTIGLWGIVGVFIAFTSAAIYTTQMADMQQQINSLETRIEKKQLHTDVTTRMENSPVVQGTSLQTLSEFYQTFPTAVSIPDTLSELNALAAKQQLLLNSGDYKLQKVVANNNNPKVLTQYEMVLPVEGSYSRVRAFISSILSNIPSVAISDIQIERENTLTPSIDARLVLILYVRGDPI